MDCFDVCLDCMEHCADGRSVGYQLRCAWAQDLPKFLCGEGKLLKTTGAGECLSEHTSQEREFLNSKSGLPSPRVAAHRLQHR